MTKPLKVLRSRPGPQPRSRILSASPRKDKESLDILAYVVVTGAFPKVPGAAVVMPIVRRAISASCSRLYIAAM